MPLRSCCLTLAGEPCLRIGSFAGPFRVSVRLSACGHLQPLVHRARVPWPYLALTRVRVVISALAPLRTFSYQGSTCVDSTAAMVARSNNTLRPKCDHDSLAGPCNVVQPAKFNAVAAEIMRVFASA